MTFEQRQLRRRRLMNVARALRDAEAKALRFGMGAFGVPNFDDGATCGTPMCALGHYAARGDLQDEFTLRRDTGELCLTGEYKVLLDVWPVASEHFGITYEQCRELFESFGCGDATTLSEAALYIEDFVRRNGEAA